MENYKAASRMQLRVATTHGELNVEQLWGLSLNKIATILKNLKKQLNVSGEDSDLDFLDETKVVDQKTQLAFDILKDIYITRKAEAEEAKTALQRKENNERIMALIAQKEESALGEKSVEELRQMLM